MRQNVRQYSSRRDKLPHHKLTTTTFRDSVTSKTQANSYSYTSLKTAAINCIDQLE